MQLLLGVGIILRVVEQTKASSNLAFFSGIFSVFDLFSYIVKSPQVCGFISACYFHRISIHNPMDLYLIHYQLTTIVCGFMKRVSLNRNQVASAH